MRDFSFNMVLVLVVTFLGLMVASSDANAGWRQRRALKRLSVEVMPDGIADVKRVTANLITLSDSDIVAYYRFEGNGNDVTGNNNGIVKGGQFVNGKKGRGLLFDGLNDYVAISHSASLDITGSLTIAAWVKLSPKIPKVNDNLQVYIVAKGPLLSAGTYKLYAETATQADEDPHPLTFGFVIKTVAGPKYGERVVAKPDSGNPFDDEWHHVAGTSDGTALTLYIDGVQKATKKINGRGQILSRRFDVAIGGWGYTKYRMVRGVIDEVRIYNRALTSDEIRILAGRVPEIEPSHGELSTSGQRVGGRRRHRVAGFWRHRRVRCVQSELSVRGDEGGVVPESGIKRHRSN